MAGLWASLFISQSQNIQISGITNSYLRVDEVQTDRVRVTDVIGGQIGQFQPENKALLIQMTGGELNTPANFETAEIRTRKTFNNTGTYEVLQIDQISTINATQAWIIFTDNIARSYNAGEKIQLVRFAEGETVSTTGVVTALDWNGNVGGIVAIIGTDSVKLNHNIDVSGQGFRGGAIPDENYTGGCRYGLSSSVKDTLFFLPTELNRSGNKGEGIMITTWPYTKGTGFALNGGGAGNGLNSGGGGGSNYRVGGDGGRQSPTCTGPYPALGGWGGYGCFELYSSSNRRIIMGGGGGSATRLASSTPSKGGDGGGIVIILTGVLSGNGKSVISNGETATSTSGGGGGGGAGGTVIIDATSYAGALNISIKGGRGGNTTDAANCTGSGGGGSGGVLWYSGSSIPAAVDTALGAAGSVAGSCSLVLGIPGTPGSTGVKLKNLLTPLTGFLFNSIRGTDTVCAGLTPNMLTASQPKGGDGTYVYYWEQSTNQVSWSSATGTNVTLRTFQPPALNQTTFYRRVVTSNFIFDTSRVIEIFVYPAITNNTISGIDTICYNSSAKLITGNQPAGGNGSSYLYQWQGRDNQSPWSNIGAALATNTPLDPGKLTRSMYYRRLVSSTPYCNDTSNTDMITVLPLITNNAFITSDTNICVNTSPGQLNALPPAGGDGSYTYLWQSKISAGNWTSLSGSNVMRYAPGVLAQETLYRRIVYSGNDQACMDTGSIKTVHTMPLITNNSILGSPVQYTCYNTPVTLGGSQPQDGFNTYAYQWEQSSDNVSWNPVAGSDRDFTSANLTTRQYFRRIVYSSPVYRECSDVSDTVEVRINPLPAGDVIEAFDTVCAGESLYVKFNLSGNGPFNVTLSGLASGNRSKNGITTFTDSISFTPSVTETYTMYSVEDDSGCFADAIGFSGIRYAEVYAVPVANAGSDDEVCGNTYALQAIKSVSGSSGYWTGTGASFASLESATSSVTSDAFGENTFTWTENNWKCSDEDEVTVTFYEPPDAPDAGPDQVLDFTYTTQLQASAPSVGTGKWTVESGSGSFDDDASPGATVSALADATSLTWTVTNGACPPLSDNMQITINPLTISKGFTPNGDSKNDVFDIGAANAEQIRLRVFNSTGLLVFESDDYQAGELWNGYTMDGVELPEGTYFYIVDIKVAGKQEMVQFRSFVEILR